MYSEHNAHVLCMAIFEYDSNIFLTGSADLTTKLWDIRVKQPVQNFYKTHESAINTVEFFPTNEPTTFASGSDDATIKLHDIRMSKELVTFADISNKSIKYESICSIAFSNTGRFIFAGTENPNIKVWDVLGNGQTLSKSLRQDLNIYVDPKKEIKIVKRSADGYALACVGSNTNGFWVFI